LQEKFAAANKAAWESKAYQAWVSAHGSPEELAKKLQQDHRRLLRYWLKYIGNSAGKRVLNLLGSNGRKAISLALLGADVTVVDISEQNRLYAMDTAEAAGVNMRFICSDALRIPNEEALGRFDIVLMEFGIMHYFTDLDAILSVVSRRLRSNGRYLLTDFHPFARMIANQPDEPAPNYFDDSSHEGDVAYTQLLPEQERAGLSKVLTRSWTAGDIITAVGTAGLFIRTFEEIPGSANPRFPQFYTLVADKAEVGLPPLFPPA